MASGSTGGSYKPAGGNSAAKARRGKQGKVTIPVFMKKNGKYGTYIVPAKKMEDGTYEGFKYNKALGSWIKT